MNNGQNVGSWENQIKAFLSELFESKMVDFLKIEIAEFEKDYTHETIHIQEIRDLLSEKRQKSSELSEYDFLADKLKKSVAYAKQYGILEAINGQRDLRQKMGARDELAKKLRDTRNTYRPSTWLDWAASKASSVKFATHVSKLTHSSINSTSFFDEIAKEKPGILTTSTLKSPILDGAVAGNQFAPIFQFLSIELDGFKLANELSKENNNILAVFAKNDEQLLRKWNQNFKKALFSDGVSSHFLAKQVYYPITPEGDQYHLLCNLVSSSMAHAIFETLFSEEQKQIKKIKIDKKFHNGIFSNYPQKAVIAVTASNHNNASQLNGKRGGKLYLLNAEPPIWQSQPKPPTRYTSFFNIGALVKANDQSINGLCKMLLTFETAGISFKDPNRLQGIVNWCNDIVDRVLTYATHVQSLPAGWSSSKEVCLKKEHAYFLDPWHPDDAFQSLRRTVDWQSVVVRDFAEWVNHQLHRKDKKFTPQPEHRKLWAYYFADALRKFEEASDYEYPNYPPINQSKGDQK